MVEMTDEGANIFPNFRPSAYVASPSKTEENVSTTSKHIYSGTDDKFLNHQKEILEKDTVLLPGVRFNASMSYGGGLMYGRLKRENGEEWIEPFQNDEIDAFPVSYTHLTLPTNREV